MTAHGEGQTLVERNRGPHPETVLAEVVRPAEALGTELLAGEVTEPRSG